MHIGETKRKRIILDNNDNILNYNGEIASVFHQYNRHKDIVEKMNQKFNDEDLNKTIYKKSQQDKNILSKKEIIKFCFIFLIIFIIIFMIIIYIIRKLKNYILKQKNKLRRVKIVYNIKNNKRTKFNSYKRIKQYNNI